MTDSEIDSDINFIRAKKQLDSKIHSPEYLILMWRLVGRHFGKIPKVERVQPWYRGIEKYII